jgi:hypothetical protein
MNGLKKHKENGSAMAYVKQELNSSETSCAKHQGG